MGERLIAKSTLALLFVLGVSLIGCNGTSGKAVQTAIHKGSPEEGHVKSPFRRFEPVYSKDGHGIALDTVTGQWCKTWNWKMHPRNPSVKGLNDLPLCTAIYENLDSLKKLNDALGAALAGQN